MDAQEQKLRQSIWITIGVGLFLTIALAAGLITQVVNKQRQQITVAQSDYASQKAQADKLPGALKEKQKAEDRREYAKGQLAFLRQRFRSLRFDALDPAQVDTANLNEEQRALLTPLVVANRDVAFRRWMNEYATGYGPALRRELIDAANDAGVILKTSVKVGDPPRIPEEVIPPTNSLLRPTGGALPVSVEGSLSNIMQFLARINQSSILMLVGNDLKLTGYSPDITATFSITPYLLATGAGAPVTAAGGGAPAAASSAGGYSGSGGSYPGSGGGYPGGGSPVTGPSGAPPSTGGSENSAGGGGIRSREPSVE